jgi:hypothetical protein
MFAVFPFGENAAESAYIALQHDVSTKETMTGVARLTRCGHFAKSCKQTLRT